MEGVELLDALLVPLGLLVLVVYHARLAYRVHTCPTMTVIGINQINRQLWIRAMMQDGQKNGVLAVQTLRNNIMASTLLATAAITLCSVIAMLAAGGGSGSGAGRALLGDRRAATSSLKLLCVFVCFLVGFLCNVQAVRYYGQLSFLVSITPATGSSGPFPEHSAAAGAALLAGAAFWSVGLRAFYFSFPLFLWLFGPVPMFLCSLALTALLHFLDSRADSCKPVSLGVNPQEPPIDQIP